MYGATSVCFRCSEPSLFDALREDCYRTRARLGVPDEWPDVLADSFARERVIRVDESCLLWVGRSVHQLVLDIAKEVPVWVLCAESDTYILVATRAHMAKTYFVSETIALPCAPSQVLVSFEDPVLHITARESYRFEEWCQFGAFDLFGIE